MNSTSRNRQVSCLFLVVLTVVTLFCTPANADSTFQLAATWGTGLTDTTDPLVMARRNAVQYAVDRWNSWLTTTVPGTYSTRTLQFGFSDLGQNSNGDYILGLHPSSWQFANGLALTPAQYLVATGNNPGGVGSITFTSNSNIDWYYGTDAKGTLFQDDLVSVTMHEIGHELGFAPTYNTSLPNFWGAFDWGSLTYYLSKWDKYLQDQNGYSAGNSLTHPFNVTGTVTFVGTAAMAANGNQPVGIFAPNPYLQGSSLSHVDNGSDSALMYYANQGSHGLWDYEVGMFQDLGWSITLPSTVHATGYNGSDGSMLNNGNTWDIGLPPAPNASVYLDAATTTPYRVIVGKTAALGDVVINGMATMEFRADSSLENLTLAGGTLTGTGTVAVNTGIYAQSGVISATLTGAASLTKSTNGTLQLNKSSNYSGSTTISGGIVRQGAANATPPTNLTITNATFDMGGFAGRGANITLNNGTITNSGAAAIFTSNNDPVYTFTGNSLIDSGVTWRGILNTGNWNVVNAGDVLTINAILGQMDLFRKSGEGTLVLNGANTFIGASGIDVWRGAVTISNSSSLGIGTHSVYLHNQVSGVALNFQNSITFSKDLVSVNGTGIDGHGVIRNLSGENTLSGNIGLSGNSTFGVDSGSLTLNGTVSGAYALTKIGGGLMVMAGANTYTGATNIQEGTLRAGAANVISASSAVTVASTFDLNGHNQSVGSVAAPAASRWAAAC